MGLLKPTKGEIFIDDNNLYDSKNYGILSSWRSAISHVPQDIFLSDSNFLNKLYCEGLINIGVYIRKCRGGFLIGYPIPRKNPDPGNIPNIKNPDSLNICITGFLHDRDFV